MPPKTPLGASSSRRLLASKLRPAEPIDAPIVWGIALTRFLRIVAIRFRRGPDDRFIAIATTATLKASNLGNGSEKIGIDRMGGRERSAEGARRSPTVTSCAGVRVRYQNLRAFMPRMSILPRRYPDVPVSSWPLLIAACAALPSQAQYYTRLGFNRPLIVSPSTNNGAVTISNVPPASVSVGGLPPRDSADMASYGVGPYGYSPVRRRPIWRLL